MYDVIYLDPANHSQPLASAVARDSAIALARTEARRRKVGRMFLAGSEQPRSGELVVIVETAPRFA
jgi:hypothetical protein